MLGSTIRSEIAEIIARDLADPRLIGLPSITRVKVSSDLSVADVYITVMGTPGQQSAALNALRHSAGMMRTRITKALSLRVAPMLKFHLDEQLKKELETLAILNKVAEENRQLDLQRAAAAGDSAATADTEEDKIGDESKAE
jgi:ribosome-binding factor A